MDVIKRSTSGYSQDPTKYFNFSRYKKRCGDFTLIEGAFEESTLWKQFDFTESELEELLKKKIVRLNLKNQINFL